MAPSRPAGPSPPTAPPHRPARAGWRSHEVADEVVLGHHQIAISKLRAPIGRTGAGAGRRAVCGARPPKARSACASPAAAPARPGPHRIPSPACSCRRPHPGSRSPAASRDRTRPRRRPRRMPRRPRRSDRGAARARRAVLAPAVHRNAVYAPGARALAAPLRGLAPPPPCRPLTPTRARSRLPARRPPRSPRRRRPRSTPAEVAPGAGRIRRQRPGRRGRRPRSGLRARAVPL